MEDHQPHRNMLSLQDICLRRIAILLWNEEENLDVLRGFHFKSKNDNDKLKEWNAVVDQVAKQVPKLELPAPLEGAVVPFLKPIGSEILKWRSFHENYFYYFSENFNNYLDVLSWFFDGVIDYRKTAENILRLKSPNNVAGYQIACLFCLENDIRVQWGRLTDREKTGSYSFNFLHSSCLVFWTRRCDSDYFVLDNMIEFIDNLTIYQYAFENAAINGNFVATQYFFVKLTFQEREDSLVKVALKVAENTSFEITTKADGVPKESYRDILCYLFLHMTKEEQIQVFKKNAFKILHCFMDWPWQSMFGQVLKKLSPNLNEEDYQSLIYILAHNFNVSAYNYSKLFQEVFLQTSVSNKRAILRQQCQYGTFLMQLFDANDVENIKLVLKYADSFTKEKLFMCNPGFHICRKLIMLEKWSLLEMFILECGLSNEVRANIKKKFVIFLRRVSGKKRVDGRTRNLGKFFAILTKKRGRVS